MGLPVGLGVCVVLLAAHAYGGPLEDYVNRFDPHYKYDVLKNYTYKGPDFTLYILNMTSQKWKDGTYTRRSAVCSAQATRL